MEKLTPKQKEILDHITHAAADTGCTPTIREIAASFKLSIGAIQKHLKALVKKGYLKHKAGLARGLEPANRKPLAAVPVLGRVPAGLPVPPLEDAGDFLYVDKNILRSGNYYALKVKGDSMTGAGIFEGDLIVVRQQPVAEDGEIVVALVEGEATVKKLRKKGDTVYLEAANPKYAPIEANEISVLGKVVYLTRALEKN
jgi:repressor LexA